VAGEGEYEEKAKGEPGDQRDLRGKSETKTFTRVGSEGKVKKEER
jgi:hypothetical protein